MDLFGNSVPGDEWLPEAEAADNAAASPQAGLQPPRMASICLGHEPTGKKLLAFHARGQIPHGLMFAGPKGIGKATMAYRFARFLLKNKPADPNQSALFDAPAPAPKTMDVDPQDPVFRRVASGGHPDLMTAERAYDSAKNRTKDILDVAEIRKVPSFLRMTSAEGGWRIVIIDDADTMNRNAQNALLKILEEPPANALLILIAHRPGALIPTIRSRVQTVTFQPLDGDILGELLKLGGASTGPGELEALTQLCGGSIGKALELTGAGGLETLGKTLAALDQYPRWDWPALHKLADDIGGYGREQAFDSFQNIVNWIFARLASTKARGSKAPEAVLARGVFESLLKSASLEQLLKICENLESHFRRADFANLDKRQAVLGAFSLISI